MLHHNLCYISHQTFLLHLTCGALGVLLEESFPLSFLKEESRLWRDVIRKRPPPTPPSFDITWLFSSRDSFCLSEFFQKSIPVFGFSRGESRFCLPMLLRWLASVWRKNDFRRFFSEIDIIIKLMHYALKNYCIIKWSDKDLKYLAWSSSGLLLAAWMKSN